MFGTATGRRQGATNVRRRVLTKAVGLANTRLAESEVEPLPEGLTPHSLRRTFASLLFAIGEAPPYVMAQMGHTTPNLTLAVYARQMDRRDGEPERLKALVEGPRMGTNGHQARQEGSQPKGQEASKANRIKVSGRVAQRESARFTRERSLVRNQPCPSVVSPVSKPISGGGQMSRSEPKSPGGQNSGLKSPFCAP